jgi:glycosyltransferase involved in cell wall biosynthesis
MKVSVVIPTRNEEAALPCLLDSLLHQSKPPDEILIADGGSVDRTIDVATTYAREGVRALVLGPAYPGRGRNAGVLAARNEWIAFIDAGCEADPRWIEALTGEVGADPARPAVVFGSYRVRLATEWERAQAVAHVPPVDAALGCRPPFIASSLVHRVAWEAAGRFREDLRAAEDLLFFEGLIAAAVPVMRSARAVVTWRLAQGPGGVFRRFRLYSAHHLAAGVGRTWHRRVMAMDVAALLLAAAGALAPAAFAVLTVAALARLAKTVLERGGNIAPASPWRPDRLARVALLLLLADLATWAGALDHVRGRAASRTGDHST